MQYVMLVEIDWDDASEAGDDSIELAARYVNDQLTTIDSEWPIEVRPLSEILAC